MGSRALVDTEVLVDYVRERAELPEARLYITEITLYEFIRGAKDPAEAKRLLEERFTVVYHDNEVIEKAAELSRQLRKAVVPLDDRDLLIAAAAIVRRLPLLTKNVKRFKRLEGFRLELHPAVEQPSDA